MTNEASEENVRVAVRCRPLLDNEKEDACVEVGLFKLILLKIKSIKNYLNQLINLLFSDSD